MNEDELKVLLEWWKDLENKKGDRAELKRARAPAEVVFCEAYHRLYNRILCNGRDKDKLAAIAGLAAHVKSHNEAVSVAEQMAVPKTANNNNPIVSGLRFRRILAIKDTEELYIPLIRAIKILGGNVNLFDLAKSVYEWNEKTKKDWAYKYWKKAPQEK
jgi:CRISPR system Cascade subunit CasB